MSGGIYSRIYSFNFDVTLLWQIFDMTETFILLICFVFLQSSIVAVAQYSTSKLDKTRVNELWVMDQSLVQADIGLQ